MTENRYIFITLKFLTGTRTFSSAANPVRLTLNVNPGPGSALESQQTLAGSTMINLSINLICI